MYETLTRMVQEDPRKETAIAVKSADPEWSTDTTRKEIFMKASMAQTLSEDEAQTSAEDEAQTLSTDEANTEDEEAERDKFMLQSKPPNPSKLGQCQD